LLADSLLGGLAEALDPDALLANHFDCDPHDP